jgi:signal transduction histidine kinase
MCRWNAHLIPRHPEGRFSVLRAADALAPEQKYLVHVKRLKERFNWGDAVIAVLFLGSAIELGVTSVDYKPTAVPFALLAAPPLFLRNRFPLFAPAATFAAAVAMATVDPHGAKDLSLIFFVAIAGMVTFGASAERRDAIAGGAIGLVALTYVNYKFDSGLGSYAWITGFFTAAWLVGFTLRLRQNQATEAHERAERAEQERELRALAAVAEERARIARELHDIVGHSVSVMTVQAAGVRRLLGEGHDREREGLLAIEETGRAALTEMRRLVGVLRRADEEAALAPQPSLEHIANLVEQTRDAGLPTELRVEGETTALPQGIDLTAYRLVQEGLTNALKHANATHAEVVVRYSDGNVELVVRDDGRGEGNGEGGGHGLLGMRERVALWDGELFAGPRADGGFELRARLPVTA